MKVCDKNMFVLLTQARCWARNFADEIYGTLSICVSLALQSNLLNGKKIETNFWSAWDNERHTRNNSSSAIFSESQQIFMGREEKNSARWHITAAFSIIITLISIDCFFWWNGERMLNRRPCSVIHLFGRLSGSYCHQ